MTHITSALFLLNVKNKVGDVSADHRHQRQHYQPHEGAFPKCLLNFEAFQESQTRNILETMGVHHGVDFNTPRIFMITRELNHPQCMTIVVITEHGVDFDAPRIFTIIRELKDPECGEMIVTMVHAKGCRNK